MMEAAWMTEAIAEETAEARVPFEADDDHKAEWCLRKIREKQAEKEKWKAHYDELFRKIAEQIDGDVGYFTGQLEHFFRMRQAEGFTKDTRTQSSYPLPSGKLILKKQEPEYERDDEALVAWLEENDPEMVKIRKAPDWAALKKKLAVCGSGMMTADAEIVPGIKVTERPDKFTVEVK